MVSQGHDSVCFGDLRVAVCLGGGGLRGLYRLPVSAHLVGPHANCKVEQGHERLIKLMTLK